MPQKKSNTKKKFWEKDPKSLTASDLRLMSRAISGGWLKQGMDGFSTIVPQMASILNDPIEDPKLKIRAADVLLKIFNSSLSAAELEDKLSRLDEGLPTDTQGITFVIKEAENPNHGD
jgi:hypothetical protein